MGFYSGFKGLNYTISTAGGQ